MSRDFTNKDKNMATIAENRGSGGVTLVLGTGGGGGGGVRGWEWEQFQLILLSVAQCKA